MKLTFQSGGSSVHVGPELERVVRRVVEGSSPRLLDRMESTAETLAGDARKDWPVSKRKKAHSRDAIEVGGAIGKNSVSTFVLLEVPYAFYIRTFQNGLKGKSPWQELLRKPGIRAGRGLARECAADLAKLAGGR